MKKGTALRCVAVCAVVLLTTLGSAFAAHTASGGGTYIVDPENDILSQFQFSPGFLQCKVGQFGTPTEFQMFMFSITIETFNVSGNTVTITGEMVSTTVLGVGPDRETFAETVPYVAVGEDNASDADFFSMTVTYSALKDQGRVFESLEFGTCDDGETGGIDICIITFEGTVESGNVNVHQE